MKAVIEFEFLSLFRLPGCFQPDIRRLLYSTLVFGQQTTKVV
jgi:hypothetical protein